MNNAKFKRTDSRELTSAVVSTERNSIKLEDNEINVSDIPLDNPVTGTVYGTLLNFRGTLERLGDAVNDKPYLSPPVAPVLYIKPANTFNRYGAGIPVPENESNLEMGASLGIVIGKTAVALTKETAMDYVAGYTIVNDVSVPHASLFRPAVQHKCRDGFCSIGPWIIDRDELKNPDDVIIRVYINDELKQENSTNNLIRPVARLLVDVTEFMTLSQGDVLLVGVPENAPLAKTGDKVRIEIEGVGSLENVLVDEQSFSGGATQ
ncbi:fumarylacetoacetate hydrolase family protein [Paenisporosarcina sp.]|uniref:fumarylacetoacetate hydrolase family protein n=1 Tax=Paenisporosarcina sp. TaxID=1932001 RepID=UPI003C76B10A